MTSPVSRLNAIPRDLNETSFQFEENTVLSEYLNPISSGYTPDVCEFTVIPHSFIKSSMHIIDDIYDIPIFEYARGGNRTLMISHRILSPARLPVPPLSLIIVKKITI